MYFNGSKVEVLNYDVFLSLNLVLIIGNSADPDEMQRNAAFHLVQDCLLKYSLGGFQFIKGYHI